ncbi:MAG TPA: DUF692 family protein [Planctomycetota bacterium]|nr:DUF692 family protein [Planctomycetota bacterium]
MRQVGINLHSTEDFRLAVLPLLESDEISVIEYSFDTGWPEPGPPDRVSDLVDYYGAERKLLGHGVTYSPLSAAWNDADDSWIKNFATEVKRRKYAYVTEHFGFLRGGNFHDASPLPVPLSATSLRVGRDRLKRLSDITGAPVGMENLAFAFCREDVQRQGEFLDKLVEPDGFLLLDTHNLYCQAVNFDIEPAALLDTYPLNRVRELHVAGGSWCQTAAGVFRRDTHNNPITREVFSLLQTALARCPKAETVIFERFGGTMLHASEQADFVTDFRKLKELVAGVDNER